MAGLLRLAFSIGDSFDTIRGRWRIGVVYMI